MKENLKSVPDVSPSEEHPNSDWMGSCSDVEILGDIISPATDEAEWEVLRD